MFFSSIITCRVSMFNFFRVEESPAIYKLFPKADIKFIPDSGHWLHAEKPQEFLQMVVEFLDKCRQSDMQSDEN